MHLTQDLERLREEIWWELKEWQSWLLPHTNKVNQQSTTLSWSWLLQPLKYKHGCFTSVFQISWQFLPRPTLNSEPCRKGNSRECDSSLAKMTQHKAITVHPLSTWHPKIPIFTRLNFQIKFETKYSKIVLLLNVPLYWVFLGTWKHVQSTGYLCMWKKKKFISNPPLPKEDTKSLSLQFPWFGDVQFSSS